MSSLSPLPQAGAKAVLDATAANRMGNQLLAFQEQYFKAFPQTTRQATGGKRPALGLNQVDPIVGMAIAEAMDGQISLLHEPWHPRGFGARAICTVIQDADRLYHGKVPPYSQRVSL